ncbi:hypothetical protein RRF57_001223 [Xylaria bambusicola]|uniref:Uncharacterized protein n=1 Tax=Xylaria bambusicola TaxID=326684 RepID=A0AAN7Z3B5_9PEZI
MADIEQDAVDQHQGRLKNVEVPLVSQDWTRWGALGACEGDGGLDLKVFDSPVDSSREDDGATNVECDQ